VHESQTVVIGDVFPHVGESLLERIIAYDPGYVLKQLGLSRNHLLRVHRQIPMVFPNTPVMFDGFSTVDLGLHLVDDTILPIEVKLGHTGLARATMNKKLAPCTVSGHTTGKRISGNILAVLNRNFSAELADLISSDTLHARLEEHPPLPVTSKWAVVVRDHVLESWSRLPPNFNDCHCKLSLESICLNYGRDKIQ